jgi:hypothetical protein
VLLVALALIVPGAARAILRQRRWRQIEDPARGPSIAWAELRDCAIDCAAPWDDDRSPRQIATTLLADLDAIPQVRESMRRLVRCEEQSRYAPVPTAELGDLRSDVLAVSSAVAAPGSKLQRIRVVILPRSTLSVMRRAVTRTIGRWDRIWRSRQQRVAAAVRRRARAVRT